MYTCKYCGKECKNHNSWRNHERMCKMNPDRHLPVRKVSTKGRVGWSRGLTKDTDERLKRCSDGVRKYFETHPGPMLGRHHSEETKQQLSENAVKKGFSNHFGQRHYFDYNGVIFQSSYELTVAKNLDENSVKWQQATKLPYTDTTGKLHYYTADLYLPDYDVYLDPKNNYLIENNNPYFGYKDIDKIKWVMEQNNVKIIVLDKDHLSWDMIYKLIMEG